MTADPASDPAPENDGWWRVWTGDGHEIVRAGGEEEARALALHEAEIEDDPEDEEISVEPYTDPEKLKKAVAGVLRWAGDVLYDDIVGMDIPELEEGTPFDDLIVAGLLPAIYARHYTPEFLTRFATTINRTADVLSRYPDSYLASTIEELAAHAILNSCGYTIEVKLDLNQLTPYMAALVLNKLEEIHECAFEDWDVLMLFDQKLDGIAEDPTIVARMGFANLSVEDWFKPFHEDEAETAEADTRTTS